MNIYKIILIIIIFLIILFYINRFPIIKYNKLKKDIIYDKFNLNPEIICSFISIRSYITYIQTQNINYPFMDKIILYEFLKKNNIPIPKLYYYSNENFNIQDKIDYFLNKNIPFVIKPSHLSDNNLCYIIKNGINVLDNKKVIGSEIQDKITKNIHKKAYKYDNIKPGIIIQENLDINGVNEWKCLCIWGKVQLCNWRINHNEKFAYIDANFNIYNFYNKNKIKLPSFKEDIFKLAEKISDNIPLLRVDILWNENKFVVNEIEPYPGGFFGIYNEIKLMNLIKEGYRTNNHNINILYEIKAYCNSIKDRIDVLNLKR